MKIILIPILAPFLSLFIQMVIHRSFLRQKILKSPQKWTIMVLLFVTLFMTASSFWLLGPETTPIQVLYLFITSACFNYFYFHVFNMSETARRIHIITALEANESDLQTYTPDNMIDTRIQRAMDLGVLMKKDHGFYAKKGALLYASLFFEKARSLLFPVK